MVFRQRLAQFFQNGDGGFVLRTTEAGSIERDEVSTLRATSVVKPCASLAVDGNRAVAFAGYVAGAIAFTLSQQIVSVPAF